MSGVGDIESNTRGSGARYNNGKPKLEYIPFRFIAASYKEAIIKAEVDKQVHVDRAYCILLEIANFQETGSIVFLDRAMEIGRHYWEDCAHVFEYGAKKYASWNWVKGMMWSVPLGCIGRHTLKIFRGEITDDESGFSHLGHIMCNVVMLRTFAENYPEGKDLPPPKFKVE